MDRIAVIQYDELPPNIRMIFEAMGKADIMPPEDFYPGGHGLAVVYMNPPKSKSARGDASEYLRGIGLNKIPVILITSATRGKRRWPRGLSLEIDEIIPENFSMSQGNLAVLLEEAVESVQKEYRP
jgi:hypothetical protein